MAKPKQQIVLTKELVASTLRHVNDPGPPVGTVPMSDEDYNNAVRGILSSAPSGDVWLFAYGSLLWKPACEVGEARNAVVRGWHRSFCFRVPRFRGTPERPGLMMALDRGGQSSGMIFKIADPVEQSLNALFRREMTVNPPVNLPRWLNAQTAEGPVRVIGFVVNPKNNRYAGRLALEKLGIHDTNLWALQELVAERLMRKSKDGAVTNEPN